MKRVYLILFILSSLCISCTEESNDSLQLVSFVDPFIGTGVAQETEGMMANFVSGNVHPGALVPWGMVTFAPRNVLKKTDVYCGSDVLSNFPTGYLNGAESIYGFSHNLISGSGCPDMGNILVMPAAGKISANFSSNKSSYINEQASPGYYSVLLEDPEILVESTVSQRTSFSSYTFSQDTDSANIIIDLHHSMIAASDAYIKIISDTEIEGWSSSGCFCNSGASRIVHFVARFDQAFYKSGTYNNNGVYTDIQELSGQYTGAYMSFKTNQDEPILMKVGISYVSIENARENLNTEQENWNFEQSRTTAENEWEKELSKIQVEGGTREQNVIFYTALYHALLHPNVVNDINGEYLALGTKEIKKLPSDRRNHYSIYSLWDTYRNLHPLLTLVYPERQSEMVKTMLDMYKTSGFLPKWEITASESYTMVGDPACPVITDTYLKGIRNFDVNMALEAMKKSSDLIEDNPIRPGNEAYNEFGYLPFDHSNAADCWGVAASTLEYNYADWCIAELARSIGKKEDYKKYYAKSMGYKKLYDSDNSFLVPKNMDGSVIENFDIDTLRGSLPGDWESGGPGYVEGNAWQYNFFVPHDIPGLAEMMEVETFVDKLQSCFDYPGRFMLFNEPDMAYPYLFDYIEGEGWRTQMLVRKTMEKYFNVSPGGLPGNDDCGTLSSWYVFSALGFYPACPGSTKYQIGSPIFDRVSLKLNTSYYPVEEFIIESLNNSKENIFIQNINLNGKEYSQQSIDHYDIINGSKIVFEMGASPK
jgi:predicted alpha-1,2-mannosidase